MTTTSDGNGDKNLKAPQRESVDVGAGSLAAAVRSGVSTVGEIGVFTATTIKDFPDMFRRYIPEIFRQAGILIIGSGLIIWFMMFMIGAQCGLEASYTLDQIGAPLYSGVFNAYCGLREMGYYMFAWILAAKVSCGYVAELGSMRISDEIDAMEVMGVKSKSYLVGTRLAAMAMAGPFIFLIGLGMVYIAQYLVTVVHLGQVSTGGYQFIFWLYQNPYDFLAAMITVMVGALVVVSVGLYYGYTASGGPVGVGRATAKSMVLNLVLISLIGLVTTLLFWGLEVHAPVGN